MSTKNEITGDSIQSRSLSEEGRENWQRIFGRVEDKVEEEVEQFFFVNRLEVIKEGRLLTQYLELDEKLELSYQDGGCTLKVFINKR
jgi:hypothetical protein|tara:strand:- start:376 stop:636 length:261 start_codon:yes stop_codon:yes gene_type:complete